MRFGKVPAAWIPILYAFGTLLPALVVVGASAQAKPSWTILGIGLLAGISNGIGAWFYGKLVASNLIQTSTILPIAAAVTPVLIAVWSAILLNEKILTAYKISGLLAVALGIWMLTLG